MISLQDKAPEFELTGYFRDETRSYKLQNYRNKWVILWFYPLDFTAVSQSELLSLSTAHEELRKISAEVFGISADSPQAHRVWAKESGEFAFPLLSDNKRRISHLYGVLDENAGTPQRATIIIDPDGLVRWTNSSSEGTGRSVTETIRALRSLQTGKPTPADWQPGQETVDS